MRDEMKALKRFHQYWRCFTRCFPCTALWDSVHTDTWDSERGNSWSTQLVHSLLDQYFSSFLSLLSLCLLLFLSLLHLRMTTLHWLHCEVLHCLCLIKFWLPEAAGMWDFTQKVISAYTKNMEYSCVWMTPMKQMMVIGLLHLSDKWLMWTCELLWYFIVL